MHLLVVKHTNKQSSKSRCGRAYGQRFTAQAIWWLFSLALWYDQLRAAGQENIVHMKTGNDELHFFYDASNKPAIVELNGTRYAYLHNLQGDIVAILDSTGTAVVQYNYDAWGRPISKTGSLANTLGTVQPFRYRGYVYDEETELYYLRSRFYSSVWCRFINADCIFADTNFFGYCANNPVTYSDTSGMESQPVLRQYRSLASQIETHGYAIRINPREIINSQKVQTSFSVYIRYTAPEAQELAAELYWSETNLTSWRKTKPWIGVTSKVEDLLFDKLEVPLVSDIRDMVMHFADKEDAQNETAFRKQFQEKYYLAKRNDSAVILEFTFFSTTWQEMNMNMKNGVIYKQMNWHTVEAHEMLEFANSREGKR